MLKAQKEREEKQRKYDEARERLFGAPSASPGTTSPRSATPPTRGSPADRARGRGRGGGTKDSKENKDGRPTSSTSGNPRQLFDPSYSPKPDSVYLQRRETAESGLPPLEDQVIRQPRGPDGSGRGGFGFVKREDKNTE